jgi:hypothetical protein
MNWLEVKHALRREQSFDPVDMSDPLSKQYFPFPGQTPLVLLMRSRCADHRANLPLAACPSHQGAQQLLHVDAIRLGPSTAAVNRDR